MEKIQNISERLSFIAKREGISIRYLEDMIGTSQGVLNKTINNNGDVKCSIISKLLEIFPQYNAYWLLTGNGNFLFEKGNREVTLIEPNDSLTIKFLNRIEKLAEENGKLKQENEQLRNQKKTYHMAQSDIAAEPELPIKK